MLATTSYPYDGIFSSERAWTVPRVLDSQAGPVSLPVRILITDGEQRASLATVRSLGVAGYTAHVCSSSGHSIAGQSRYCATETRVPDPLGEPAKFAEEVVRLAASLRVDLLLPVTEASLLAVLPVRQAFDCDIPFASADQFNRICDKAEVLRVANARGIAVPIQKQICCFPTVSDNFASLHFPVVVKPSRSVSGPESARMRNTVSYSNDERDLRKTLVRLPRSSFPVLLQERIVGPGVGVSLLIWNGELRAAFCHRRIREKPPSGGVSVLRESIPLIDDLLEASVGLLKDLDWQGVAMLEYKREMTTGTDYLMEINGRLWGSLQLAIDSGVDFPVLLVEAALGRPSPPVTKYRIGIRSRWEWGDVDNLLAVLFQSSDRLALPSGRPARLAAIAEFIQALGTGTQSEVLRLSDPLPFIRESVNWILGR
jgi:predicted ATP-grasp superfamily ATP-dependent carboligase